MQRGHRLRSFDQQSVTVDAVRLYDGPQHRLNLTVANFHTYYVLAGDTPVLVHNCDKTVYHYTDKDHFNKIMSGKDVTINPGSSKNGAGPFFTNRSPADLTAPNAFKKLGLTSAKSQFMIEMRVPKTRLVPLRGGRGAYVFQTPGGIKIPKSKVDYAGPTADWSPQ